VIEIGPGLGVLNEWLAAGPARSSRSRKTSDSPRISKKRFQKTPKPGVDRSRRRLTLTWRNISPLDSTSCCEPALLRREPAACQPGGSVTPAGTDRVTVSERGRRPSDRSAGTQPTTDCSRFFVASCKYGIDLRKSIRPFVFLPAAGSEVSHRKHGVAQAAREPAETTISSRIAKTCASQSAVNNRRSPSQELRAIRRRAIATETRSAARARKPLSPEQWVKAVQTGLPQSW